MSIAHAELWLAALLLGLYLKDCLLLLRPDEAVLRLGLGGRWRAGFGLRDWTLRGREPWLCPPWAPFEPVWRLPWLNTPPGPGAAGPLVVPPALLRLRPWVAATAIVLFLALPACVMVHAPVWLTLALLLLLYGLIGVALALTWHGRAALGLDGMRFAALAAEVLVCPPYAANLMRKLSLGLAHADDLAAASRRLMDAPAQAALHARCRDHLAARIAQFDASDPQVLALAPLLRHFGVAAPAQDGAVAGTGGDRP